MPKVQCAEAKKSDLGFHDQFPVQPPRQDLKQSLMHCIDECERSCLGKARRSVAGARRAWLPGVERPGRCQEVMGGPPPVGEKGAEPRAEGRALGRGSLALPSVTSGCVCVRGRRAGA